MGSTRLSLELISFTLELVPNATLNWSERVMVQYGLRVNLGRLSEGWKELLALLKTLKITLRKACFFQTCLWEKCFQAIATTFGLVLYHFSIQSMSLARDGTMWFDCSVSLCVAIGFELSTDWLMPIFSRMNFSPSSHDSFHNDFFVSNDVFMIFTLLANFRNSSLCRWNTNSTSILHDLLCVINSSSCFLLDSYLLEFDDDEEDGSSTLPQRTVPFHKVVALPEGLRQ